LAVGGLRLAKTRLPARLKIMQQLNMDKEKKNNQTIDNCQLTINKEQRTPNKEHSPCINKVLKKSYIWEKRIMIIEQTPNEIIFRLPGNINLDDLQDLTDLFEYKELSKKSETSQKEVDDLVKSVKKGRWDRTKQQLSE